MRSYLVLIALIINISILFGQNRDADKLKDYVSYIEENYESGGWSKKCTINDKGLIWIEENYLDKKLRSRYEYYYDRYGNRYKEIQTFDPDDGVVNDEYDYKLVVDYNGVIIQRGSGNFISVYSDFTELEQAQIVEREAEYGAFPYKEVYEYNDKGSILKTVFYYNTPDSLIKISKETTQFRYDKNYNVILLYRSNSPEKEFPMVMTGGPFKYEYEKFRYVYNRDGLWKKKFKTVEGKEYLIKKRKYTKR